MLCFPKKIKLGYNLYKNLNFNNFKGIYNTKLLILRNSEKEVWFNTITNKKKMLSVPFGEDPYDMVAHFLQSDEGLDSLKMLESSLA